MNEKVKHYIYQDRYFWTMEEEENYDKVEREYYLEALGLTEDDLIGDDYKTIALRKQFEKDFLTYLGENNNDYYNNEKGNLSILDGKGYNKILAIASIGLWDGRRTGYKEIGYEISGIMQGYGCDYLEFFVEEGDYDGWDVKFRGVHHDGTHYATFRALNDGVEVDALESIVFDRNSGKDKLAAWVRENTTSIASAVASVYGWELKREQAA